MHRKGIALFCLSLLFFFTNYSISQQSKEVTCTGKVIDEQGQPIAGAKVQLYQLILSMETLSFDVELVRELDTEDDGTFIFETQADSSNQTGQTIILVEKEALALGWINWELHENLDVKIKLGQLGVLAGKVVDESGELISDAEVSISVMMVPGDEEPRYLVGKISERLFSRKTDAEGRFKFEGIPANATAEFILKKTGMAIVSTIDPKKDGGRPFQFAAGQENIEIQMPVGGGIEGTVLDKNTGRPVSDFKLIVFQERNNPFSWQEMIASKEDGVFSFDSLCPGKYVVQAVTNPGELADWLAQPVEVTIEAGKVSTGVKVELSKGGGGELIVTEEDDNAPAEGTNISFQNTVSKERFSMETGKDGIVWKRLAPGEYQITRIYKRDYPTQSQNEIFSVKDGQTSQVSIWISDYPKVAGTVRDEMGRPVAGAKVRIYPLGRGEAISNSEGRFEVRRERETPKWARPVAPYVVARHVEQNLARALEIEEDTRLVDVNMTTGIVLAGKVIDVDGKPVGNAQIYLTFWISNSGIPMEREKSATDAEGHYEIKAVPQLQEYSINAVADGYGQDYVRIATDNAVDNRLEVKPISLAPANLSISGFVVDIEDKPVDNAHVFVDHRGQPHRNTKTDKYGKFTIEGVCAGSISIKVNKTGASFLSGNIEAVGGATNIRIVAGDSSSGFVPKTPPSLIGKPLPEMKDLKIDLSSTNTNDKMMLICFFDIQQRPSRNCIIQLAEKAQELKAKDVTVIVIHASKIEQAKFDEWIKANEIDFPIGTIQDDIEKTRFDWGVRSLPWLILTDAKHIVQEEGFSINELDERIGSLREK
jgi:protocatechuate 3,4-dioxygenase beta subunit